MSIRKAWMLAAPVAIVAGATWMYSGGPHHTFSVLRFADQIGNLLALAGFAGFVAMIALGTRF